MLNCRKVECAEDAGVRLVLKEEFEGFLDQLLRRRLAASELPPVFLAHGDGVCGGREILENEILPLLRKQQGFADEVTLIASTGSEAVGISLWDTKENAEAYNRATYPEVQRLLSKVSTGTPEVKTYDVSVSTLAAVRRGTA